MIPVNSSNVGQIGKLDILELCQRAFQLTGAKTLEIMSRDTNLPVEDGLSDRNITCNQYSSQFKV